MMQFLVLHDGFVEVEEGVGQKRVGGQLGGGLPGVTRPFTQGDESLGCFGVLLEILLVKLEIVNQQIEFRFARIAASHAPKRFRYALARPLALRLHHPLGEEP